jgi:pimeloyl-ACP methyl ester carboxylesterase
VDAAGARVHYAEHGARDAGRVLVLLHGFTADHRLMSGAFEPVMSGRDGWRRIYLDLPGMGRTEAPAHIASTDDVYTVVRATIEALGLGDYAVAGESYGGYLARGLVAEHGQRVTGMALVCPMVVAEHAQRDVPAHQVLLRDAFCQGLTRGTEFDEVTVVQTEETHWRVQEEIVPGLELADLPVLERIQRRWPGTFPREPDGMTFRAPVLVFTGRQDSTTGYRDAWPLLDSYPHATFAVLDRAGHNGHIEQPALFRALVEEWLDRVEGRQGGTGRTAV